VPNAVITDGNSDRFALLKARLRLPLVVAPMFRVSGPELVIAACRSGAVGCFPTANAQTVEQLDEWACRISAALADMPAAAPWCANLIIKQPRLEADLECLIRHRPDMVITSVGSPKDVAPRLKDAGILVFADVASLKHARQALAAGVDGVVLLTAGAGGQAGWANGFTFVRAVRQFFRGPIILAGGITDGIALRAATVLGADLGYMGTRFIAADESMASPWYKQMVVDSSMDDVLLTKAFNGNATNMLLPSILRMGLDPARLDEQVTPETAAERYGGGTQVRRWADVVSAGQSVSGADAVLPASEIIARVAAEYQMSGDMA
jgi:nitronate monooxygenase